MIRLTDDSEIYLFSRGVDIAHVQDSVSERQLSMFQLSIFVLLHKDSIVFKRGYSIDISSICCTKEK